MDEFMALIGAAPTAEQDQRRLATLLSRRRNVGQLGALTGDRILAPFGAGMIDDAYGSARQVQQTRQADIDDRQTKAYQDGQLTHMADTLRETHRSNRQNEVTDIARILAGLEEARIRAGAEGGRGGSRRKMTDSTRKGISEVVGAYEGARGLRDTFKPEYSQKFGPGPQSLLPNYLSRYGMGTEGMDEAQNWWAAWQELRTLPERNRLFGATLTANEKGEWAKADINPAMGTPQVKTAVKRIMKILQDKARREARIMYADGFDQEDLELAYGDILEDDLEQMLDGQAPETSEIDAQIEELQRQIEAERNKPQ